MYNEKIPNMWQEKKEVRLGDVFVRGLDRLVIHELPGAKDNDPVFNYSHITNRKVSSVRTLGFVRPNDLQKWIESREITYQCNLFDPIPPPVLLLNLFC